MPLNEKFLKPYNPQETEPRIYKLWENSGFFNPDNLPKSYKLKTKSFSIVMPPPNATGVLHMGHALGLTIEDILIRYKRMRGFKTLWLPGTDHAAIATQARVEKEIYKKEGKTRHHLGRQALLKRIDAFVEENRHTMTSQMKTMGASCDWSREAFTLDEPRNLAVRTMFKKMYDDGLIYRGRRIVNWDPKGQTTISDDEIVYQEEKTIFYYFKYGPFTIGTSRPETKFGDKYVVMHPDDKRYGKYQDGQKLELEWINGPITATVVKDKAVDMEFGSGVMTITPWHDTADFDIAERHKLDKEQIIDERGKLLPIAGEFAGMKIADARAKVVEKLRAKGLVAKEEPYTHNLATAERTGGIIEPQVKLQWFVDVNKKFKIKSSKLKGIKSGSETSLKEIMRQAVASGEIKIIPEHFEKTYFHWIENLRDWCVSRQIWYGHRIPVWYHEPKCVPRAGHESDIEKCKEIIVAGEKPRCEFCDAEFIQDPDTLDTWFSSGLWTFSTLGWPAFAETATAGKPGPENDLANYHPTDVLETGYEILFFWVARMILISGYALGQIPFHTVYLHGTVRDAKGRKMSKSLGNGIDPIDVAKKFGADAGRMALIIGNTPGTDTNISEDKIRGYKHFGNKLWNIARFILENTEGVSHEENFEKYADRDAKLLAEAQNLLTDVTKDFEACRFYLAAEKLYHYVWHEFADKIIEESKTIIKSGDEKEKSSRRQFLLRTLEQLLKALHPFIPFVTEEIWSLWHQPTANRQPLTAKSNLLMIQEWPIAGSTE
ncbi:MAG: valine--tRNA ligase [Candidatus Taylorbacteria bacterium]|nr:valine--tRNA ligase [Candidatus Taylorbacteria bacterium]